MVNKDSLYISKNFYEIFHIFLQYQSNPEIVLYIRGFTAEY